MSLSIKTQLIPVAKEVSRELRRRSTRAENLLWQELRDRRLLGKKFRRQHPLFHDLLGKETFYVADFYCHEMKLVVELDGGIHQKQRSQDELRSSVINALGLTVVRFRNEEVEEEMDAVLEKLTRMIRNLEKEQTQPSVPFSSKEKGLGMRSGTGKRTTKSILKLVLLG